MLPDFNRLKVFYHVYSQNSIVAAARDLHISQPAVSQQLLKLETELRVALFTRLHKKLVPTAAAIQLFQIVEPFVAELQDGVVAIRQPSDKPSGHLRIGAPKEFGKEFLPFFCHSFRRDYPAVTFSLKFKDTAPLLAMLTEGDLDFALVDVFQGPGQRPSRKPDILAIEPLILEEVILACSSDYYREEIAGDHSFGNLIGKEYLSDEEDLAFLTQWFRHHFNKPAANLNIVMLLDSHEALITGVKLGMGLGILSAHLIWSEIGEGSIIPIITDRKNLVNRISLVQLQDKVPTLTEKTFLEHLHKGMRNPNILAKFDHDRQSA
jgi:DNA-binding transcriptional LysR family regulator